VCTLTLSAESQWLVTPKPGTFHLLREQGQDECFRCTNTLQKSDFHVHQVQKMKTLQGCRVSVRPLVSAPKNVQRISVDRFWGPPSLLSSGYGGIFLGINLPGRKAHDSLPPTAEVKNEWSSTSTSPVHLHGKIR